MVAGVGGRAARGSYPWYRRHMAMMSWRRSMPRHKVLTPGSPSPLRPRKPPRAAIQRVAVRTSGGSAGGTGVPPGPARPAFGPWYRRPPPVTAKRRATIPHGPHPCPWSPFRCARWSPFRWTQAIARDIPKGGHEHDDVFFSTDIHADPAAVASDYNNRCPIEVTFRDAKQVLTLQHPQSWRRCGLSRTVTVGFWLHSAVWLWFTRPCADKPVWPDRPLVYEQVLAIPSLTHSPRYGLHSGASAFPPSRPQHPSLPK